MTSPIGYKHGNHCETTYTLQLKSKTHPFNKRWSASSYRKIFKFWKILLACHPDVVHHIDSGISIFPHPSLSQRLVQDSHDYLSGSSYRSFEELDLQTLNSFDEE